MIWQAVIAALVFTWLGLIWVWLLDARRQNAATEAHARQHRQHRRQPE